MSVCGYKQTIRPPPRHVCFAPNKRHSRAAAAKPAPRSPKRPGEPGNGYTPRGHGRLRGSQRRTFQPKNGSPLPDAPIKIPGKFSESKSALDDWEIDENLYRADLPDLERAQHTATRAEVVREQASTWAFEVSAVQGASDYLPRKALPRHSGKINRV